MYFLFFIYFEYCCCCVAVEEPSLRNVLLCTCTIRKYLYVIKVILSFQVYLYFHKMHLSVLD